MSHISRSPLPYRLHLLPCLSKENYIQRLDCLRLCVKHGTALSTSASITAHALTTYCITFLWTPTFLLYLRALNDAGGTWRFLRFASQSRLDNLLSALEHTFSEGRRVVS